MADKRLDELTDIDAVASTDSIPIRDASATTELKEATMAQVATFIDAAGEASSAVATHAALTATHGVSGALVGTSDTQTLTNKTITGTTNDIDANRLYVRVRNESGSQLDKGTPVYISGYNVGQDLIEVSAADASSAATMPAIGLIAADLATNATGTAIIQGGLSGVDTSSFTAGDRLYVSETTGALTSTRPTGTARAQSIGEVLRSHATLGEIEIERSQTFKTGLAAQLLVDGTAADMRTTLGLVIGTDVQAHSSVLDGTTASYTTAEESKLAAIEANADVTDAANVETAIEAITFTAVSGATGDEVMIVDATDGGLKAVLWENLPGSGGGIANVVEDTTPQLGGQLDVNGQAIGDGTRELLAFVEDASAVNHVEIENQATGGGPIIRAAGDDTNVDLNLSSKAAGVVNITGAVTVSSTVDGRDLAADGSKLDGIEAGADVTDTANVTAAGALMDSEVDADIKTLSLPANTTISTFGASLVDDADNTAARTTLGLGSIATQAASSVSITGGSITGITDLAVADGGTGASTPQAAIANLRVAPATVTGTTDTLAAGDDGTVILYTAAGAVTVTLANIATGFEAVLVSLGAGGLSVAAGGMSFANSFTPQLTVSQGEALFVKQTAASTWIVLGGTAA